MSDTTSTAESAPTTSTSQIFTVLYALAMLACAGGLTFVWTFWNPTMGAGMTNMVGYSIILLAIILTVAWLVLFSPFRWKSVLAALALLGVMVGGAFASVREIEFNGDMGLVVHYRWQPTAQERLAAHRARQNVGGSLDSVEIPAVTPEDMPAYRGTNRDGLVTGPQLSQDWHTSPPTQLWQQPCGGGYSGISVLGNFAVTLEQRGENEAIVCYSAATGDERWVHEYPARFYEPMGGLGPRATPTIFEDAVYSYGAEGDLFCLDLATGEVRWSIDTLVDGAKNVMWALSSSPLVVENMVIVEVGGPDGDGLAAFDRSTGEVIWERPGVARLSEANVENRAGYSSPVLVELHGIRQILIFDGEGLRAHVPETGEQLWFHEFNNGAGVNVAQPILFEDGRIFLSQSYGVGCRMISVTHDAGEWQTETLWDNLNMKCKFTSPVLLEGYLYGLDEGILVCLDPETGERQWKKGRYGHGQVLLTHGQLVVMSERGDLVLVNANPDTFEEVTSFKAINSPKVWNPHALAGGIAWVRNHETMAAYDLRSK
jgi:outer membrane protein assembly factor BamB